MPIKPTGYPEWASAATNIAEPLDSKKAVGWSIGEKPASSYFNWLAERQSSWIRYLSYEWLVNDDFVTEPGQDGGAATALAFNGWGSTGATAITWREDAVVGGMGAVRFDQGISPTSTLGIERAVGFPGTRDVIFEAAVIARRILDAGSFGHTMAVGALTKEACFIDGGSSSLGSSTGFRHWWFTWSPSALGPTSVSLGITQSPSAYQRLAFERKGNTMVVEIDGQSRLAFYAGNINFTGTRIGSIAVGGVTGTHMQDHDFIRFGVRRT